MCTFSFVPEFVAKTQKPSVLDDSFEEFTIPFLHDFNNGNCDETLHCPIKAMCRYLSRMEQFHPDCKNLLVSTILSIYLACFPQFGG